MINKDYKKLIKYKNQYPELTLDNDGYKYLTREIQESHKEQIEEISEILKRNIEGFSEFNNFKPRKEDKTFDIRVQYKWSPSFIGVGYFNIEEFKENKNG